MRPLRASLKPSILLFTSLFLLMACGGLDGNPPLYNQSHAPSPELERPAGESFIRTQSTLKDDSPGAWQELPLAETGMPIDVLSPGDSIAVSTRVQGQVLGELSGSFMLSTDGAITFGRCGRVELEGMRSEDVAQALRNAANIFNQPEVTLLSVNFAPRTARIVGSFAGSAQLVDLQSQRSLLAALAAAGWTPDSNTLSTTLIRDGRSRTIPLSARSSVLAAANIELNPGDILVCTDVSHLTVIGEVASPTKITPGPDGRVSIFDVLVDVGGLTDSADPSRVRIVETDGSSQLVDLSKLLNSDSTGGMHFVRSGQTLVVPERQTFQYFVFGMIGQRNGLYESDRPLTLVQLAALAGLERFGADTDNCRLIRGWREAPQTFRFDLERVLEGDDPSGNVLLKDGDVLFIPETSFSYTLEVANRILRPLFGVTRGIGSTAEGYRNIRDIDE